MTLKPGRMKFAWMEALRGAQDLTHAEYRVLVNLSTHASGDLTGIYGSVAQVVREACVSEPTAKKAIKSLIAKGWLVLTEPGGNQYWKGKANVYALAIPKGVTDLPPTSALLPLPSINASTPISSPHLSNAGACASADLGLIGPEDVVEGTRVRDVVEMIPGGVTFAEFELIEGGVEVDAEPALIAHKILARRQLQARREDEPPEPLDAEVLELRPRENEGEPETPMQWLNNAVHGLNAEEREAAEEILRTGGTKYDAAKRIREERTRAGDAPRNTKSPKNVRQIGSQAPKNRTTAWPSAPGRRRLTRSSH